MIDIRLQYILLWGKPERRLAVFARMVRWQTVPRPDDELVLGHLNGVPFEVFVEGVSYDPRGEITVSTKFDHYSDDPEDVAELVTWLRGIGWECETPEAIP